MKPTTKLIALLAAFVLTLSANRSFGQNSGLHFVASHIFNSDSLAGFDEQAASALAVTNSAFGPEFKVFMYIQKRKYINEKYHIQPVSQIAGKVMPEPARFIPNPHGSGNKVAALPSSGACTNEDFEDAQSNPGMQVGGAVNGWSLSGGTGANYCTPSAMNATNLYTVYNAPCTDPYMIAPNNHVSSYFDATNLNQPAGSCYIRLNNDAAGAKVVKMTKTYTISPSNAIFRYAYISVLNNPGHPCCDQPGFVIHVTITNTVTNASTLLACPQVSVAAGNACGPAAPGFSLGNSGYQYNPGWVPASMDLSTYLGNQVMLEVYAIDCNYGGHAGYVYFDALCEPMNVIGNGQGFPAGTPSITLPTCGANGATITAPAGLGPYSWTSGQIGIPGNLSTPSNTNTTLNTTQSGTVLLTMNPPGACAPITKVITVSITPAPVVVGSATQAGCTNSLSIASITCAGSASTSPVITWSPTPGFVAANSMSANGLPVGTTTVTVTDQAGCIATVVFTIVPAPPPVTFTVNNLSGSSNITCTTPTVNLQVVSGYTYGTISYTWSSPSFTSTSQTISLTAANTLTLTGIDAATGCQSQKTVAIGISTTAPTSTVSPLSQAITCNAAAPVTFTGTISNPTVNMQMDWYGPPSPYPGGVPIATSNLSVSVLSGVVPPGIYTLVATNQFNGCKTIKTVTVTSLDAWPTFNVSSPTNFSIGCLPINQTTISIINAISTQSPPATCSFTFLPPGFAGTLAAGPYIPANNSTVTTLPGTWTVVVIDNSNLCKVEYPVSVVQNTVGPDVSASYVPNTQTLTCFNSSVLATGVTSVTSANVQWIQPGGLLVTTPTIVIGPGTGPNTSSTSLTYAQYTVVATNSVNACKTTSIVTFNQNFKPPVSSPLISIGTPTAIYCNAGSNPAVLTTGSSTVTSGVPNAFVANPCWDGPSPQTTVCGASSYSAHVPGVYTLTVMDSYNGCTTAGTINLLDKTQPPVITNPTSTATFDCGRDTTAISIVLTGTTLGGVRYLITEHPLGSAFTPTSANIPNINPLLAGTSSSSISVSMLGNYEYIVSNTLTGCQASGTVTVIPGHLTVDFDASTYFGYAPLGVTFNNTSHSSSSTNSITSIWSYGNGTTTVTHSNEPTSAVYNAPGTYTVMLIAQKGSCLDTTFKVIKVDIPSKLEVPNVFTPNGDGANDVLFLKTANLSEITATIFDRWGGKVYEVTSESGNIGWDGKNMQGKECPSGVYFYIIKASGRDGNDYNTKGNITLFR